MGGGIAHPGNRGGKDTPSRLRPALVPEYAEWLADHIRYEGDGKITYDSQTRFTDYGLQILVSRDQVVALEPAEVAGVSRLLVPSWCAEVNIPSIDVALYASNGRFEKSSATTGRQTPFMTKDILPALVKRGICAEHFENKALAAIMEKAEKKWEDEKARKQAEENARLQWFNDNTRAATLDEQADWFARHVAENGGKAEISYHGGNNKACGPFFYLPDKGKYEVPIPPLKAGSPGYNLLVPEGVKAVLPPEKEALDFNTGSIQVHEMREGIATRTNDVWPRLSVGKELLPYLARRGLKADNFVIMGGNSSIVGYSEKIFRSDYRKSMPKGMLLRTAGRALVAPPRNETPEARERRGKDARKLWKLNLFSSGAALTMLMLPGSLPGWVSAVLTLGAVSNAVIMASGLYRNRDVLFGKQPAEKEPRKTKKKKKAKPSRAVSTQKPSSSPLPGPGLRDRAFAAVVGSNWIMKMVPLLATILTLATQNGKHWHRAQDWMRGAKEKRKRIIIRQAVREVSKINGNQHKAVRLMDKAELTARDPECKTLMDLSMRHKFTEVSDRVNRAHQKDFVTQEAVRIADEALERDGKDELAQEIDRLRAMAMEEDAMPPPSPARGRGKGPA